MTLENSSTVPAAEDEKADKRTLTTYSMWSSFRNCRRACYWRYEERLRLIGAPAEALTRGDIVHQALECWHGTYSQFKALVVIDNILFPDIDPYYAGVTNQMLMNDAAPKWWNAASEEIRQRWHFLTAMIVAYTTRYPEETWEVIALEKQFSGEIVNPKTGTTSRSFTMGGKVDKLVRYNGKLYIVENKTCADISSHYLQSLWSRMQPKLYALALEQELGERVEGSIYNLLGKPSTNMKQRTGESEEEFEQRKAEAAAEGKNPNRLRRKMPESDREFQQRLADWYANPEKIRFHREELIYTNYDREQLNAQQWELTQEYLAARRRGIVAFYRNEDRCFDYHRACDFLPLCQASNPAAIIDAFYTRADEMHPELSSPAGQGQAADELDF